MPFKSQAQRRKFYAMADRGEISDATVERWEDETPKGKKLPERVKKAIQKLSSVEYAQYQGKLVPLDQVPLRQATEDEITRGLLARERIIEAMRQRGHDITGVRQRSLYHVPDFDRTRTKTAEPPPPKGVSAEEWDRILQKGAIKKVKTQIKEAAGRSAPVVAHELGHAQDYESRGTPRRVFDIAAPLVGGAGGAYGIIRGKPLLTGLSLLGASLPSLVDEGTASWRGHKALKEKGHSDEDLEKARTVLGLAGGTYGAAALGTTAGGIGSAALIRRGLQQGPPRFRLFATGLLPLLGGISAGGLLSKLLGGGFEAKERTAPSLSRAEMEALRKQMGVESKIYEAPDASPSYVLRVPEPVQKLREPALQRLLKDEAMARELNTQGGVLLPTIKESMAAPLSPDQYINQVIGQIKFPKREHQSIRERLAAGLPALTTRVSKERGRYTMGQILNTPWGDRVQITRINKGRGYTKHPFLKHLTPGQRNAIRRRKYDLVEFQKIGGTRIGPSSIQGQGLIANTPYEAGDTIGPAIDKVPFGGDLDEQYLQTAQGRYVNHSEDANAELVPLHAEQWGLRAKRDIGADEEVTVDYRTLPNVIPGLSVPIPGERLLENVKQAAYHLSIRHVVYQVNSRRRES